jgi:hypothetical protein
MPDASYQQNSFLGGEISQFAQGRYDRQDYRSCMALCLNGLPIETGTWTRRAGSLFAGTTKNNLPGRNITFDFEATAAYMMEFTDGFIRFRHGATWAGTNDTATVVAISTANPAVVQTSGTSWATGDTITFANYGSSTPLLQNRQFIVTVSDGTHFSIADALTGTNIDGSTLGTLLAGTTVSRIQELTTPYIGGLWENLRAVQAETTSILLQGQTPPQIITVPTLPQPDAGIDAQFAIAPLFFNDGPYFDPFTNGAQVTPSAKSGLVDLPISFPAYDSTKAYKVGDFVTSSSVNYQSIADQNVNHTPVSSPSFWETTTANAAINDGDGFTGTDIGRLVRLFSEPDYWNSATAYTAGQIVSYNPSGLPGGQTYWSAKAGNTNKIPGNDTTNWEIATNAALWTWGRITSLSNTLPGVIPGAVPFGTFTSEAGLAAAFDGTTNKNHMACAARAGRSNAYVGQNYSAATPSSHAFQGAVVYPSADIGFISVTGGGEKTITLTMYGSNSAPANSTNGTVLGTVTLSKDQTSAVSIISTDQVTPYKYAWISFTATIPGNPTGIAWYTAQVEFLSTLSSGVTNGCTVEILGPPLLYTSVIRTWRLGVYSNTTGWPTCGCYFEGRIWFGGVVANRFDASVSNGIVGNAINFAPTDQQGNVLASSGISEVLNSDGVNPIIGMTPDQQGVLMGTPAGEWLVFGPQGAITPTNITARRITRIGWANVEPRRTDHTIVAVQRYGRRIIEFFADVYSGKFSGPNLARWAMHLTTPAVAELAYQQAVVPILWFRTTDGQLRGVTYKRDGLQSSIEPNYSAFHRHVLGSGRTVTSIAVGPSADGALDTLFMVTTDGNSNYVELITDLAEEGDSLVEASYLDAAVAPSSTAPSATPVPFGGLTINGLWHLNGKIVQIWAAGLDCGDFSIGGGSVLVPYGDGVSGGTASGLFTAAAWTANPVALIGFTFTSQGQMVRPNATVETGARSGPSLGKKRRTDQYAIQVEGTQALSVGTRFNFLDPCRFRFPDDTPYAVNQPFTGIHWDMLTDQYGYDSLICWQVTRPYPVNIVAVSGFIQTMDK